MADEKKARSETKSGWAVMDRTWEDVQRKTFTKWCNSHLVKRFGSDAAIKSISEDFQTGVKLMELLNALYSVSMPKHNKAPKLRPHKLDNIELAFRMLNDAGVKTHFLKPTHLADCDTTMLLGMIWAIILDFQIKGISVEELSAKEGLLLWCKRKTQGYKDVQVDNFTTSWQDGLAFCALIHKHRPDLLDFNKLSKNNPRENLELAFDVAEKQLGITRLLDVEDIVDVPRPDERSVMTYVSEYFHKFSAQNQFEVAGRRIAKLVALAKTNDQLKNDFLQKAEELVRWIHEATNGMKERNYDNSLQAIEEQWEQHKFFKKSVKPEKTNEKLSVEASLNTLQAKLRVNNRPLFVPPEQYSLPAIEKVWQKLGDEENARSEWIRREIERQLRIEGLASRFWRKAAALLQWGSDNGQALSSTDYGESVAAVEAKLKNHDGFEANYQTTQGRLDGTKQLGQNLIHENYSQADNVKAKIGELDQMWYEIRNLSDTRKAGLLAELERQKELDNLRLEYATQSRSLISWIEDAEDTLSEPVRVASVEAIQELQNAFNSFSSENQQAASTYQTLVDLSNTLVDRGITENMYAAFTIEQIHERWTRLQNEVNQRQTALAAESTRQHENDRLCSQFAHKAKSFKEFIDSQRSEISHGLTGQIQAQLESLKHKSQQLSGHRSALEELISLNSSIDERNITHNRHTEETIETLNLAWENLNEFVVKQRNLLEKELLAQSGNGVSEEQLNEFRETFQQFDKDRSNSLEKHEFKACLSALGQSVTDEQLDQLMANICKSIKGKIIFEEFVNYMISKVEDSDTPGTINAAFKTLASDKGWVTEEELRRVLEGSVVDYLITVMPRKESGYDYVAFTEASYKM